MGPLFGLRPCGRLGACPLARPLPSRRQVRICSVMGGYQYQHRADQLRSKGVQLHEFGTRQLREGCFGEDVMELQNWLAEEAYYNPVDGGYTGYFGSVTKEALQAWQRDCGVDCSGVFDAASKSAYLTQMEARAGEAAAHTQKCPLRAAEAAAASRAAVAAAVAVTPAAQGAPPAPLAASTASLAPLALLVGACIAATALLRRKPRAGPTPMSLPAAISVTEDVWAATEGMDAEPAEAQSMPKPRVSTLRRMSEDELQRYIAPMKGEAASRTPVQRSAPRPLHLADPSTAASGSIQSKYGTYYGGRQVIDRVKSFLQSDDGPSAPTGGPAQRMASLAYDMRRPAPPRPTRANQPPQQPVQRQQQQRVARVPAAAAPPPGSAFKDVHHGEFEPASAAFASVVAAPPPAPEALLAGTDLEKAPARPVQRVLVHRPGMPAPVPPTPAAMPSTAAAAPRPVPVVKPARAGGPMTVGEAAAAAAEGAEGAAEPSDVGALAAADPRATVILEHKPIKLHKPAHIAARAQLGAAAVDAERGADILTSMRAIL